VIACGSNRQKSAINEEGVSVSLLFREFLRAGLSKWLFSQFDPQIGANSTSRSANFEIASLYNSRGFARDSRVHHSPRGERWLTTLKTCCQGVRTRHCVSARGTFARAGKGPSRHDARGGYLKMTAACQVWLRDVLARV
jgi:hypothetical protein